MSGMYDKGPVLGAAPPSVHRSNIKPGWCEHVPKDSDWLEIAFRCRMFNWLYAMMIPVIPVWVLGFSLCSIKQGLPSLRFEICPSLNIHIYILKSCTLLCLRTFCMWAQTVVRLKALMRVLRTG